MFEDMVDSIYW